MPCVGCGYDLQGLSIVGVCPECGTNVQATLLAVVDPMAEELRPVRFPTLLAMGLVAWGLGGLVAMLAAIWLVAPELPELAGKTGYFLASGRSGVSYLLGFGLTLSMLGAIPLIEPHVGIKPQAKLAAIVGVLLYAPAIGAAVFAPDLSQVSRLGTGFGGVTLWLPAPERTLWRLFAWLPVMGSLLCLRPVARTLVARSLVLRTGRVDRQTILAMAAAVGMIVVGDVLAMVAVLASPAHQETATSWAFLLGVVVWAMGAVLLIIGLLGSLVDYVLIARAVLRPSPSLRSVLMPQQAAAGRPGGQGSGGGGGR